MSFNVPPARCSVFSRFLKACRTCASKLPASEAPAPAAGQLDPSAGPLDAALNELELRLVRDAMTAAGGNQSEAARRLGVSRVGLIKKLTRLGLR